ncbi:phage tail tube protein [Paenibacillus spongiae]|uniref:Phage tail tube protein n=1 Tax=Paenibacillus spongiae TaxID=2909671 RepID=A0ABY5SHG5_9BACL|nr:phage tail tube protein [Paenibacillus spongiae]UVI32088.1 phage tail tube protein [Paenibacillus spongiae]
MARIKASKIISGTHGELWLDNEQVGEVLSFEALIEFVEEQVPVAGELADGYKFMGYNCTGNMQLHHVNSRLIKKLSASIQQGVNPEFVVVSKLDDPAADGKEVITILDATFNNLSLANWTLKEKGTIEAPFKFTKWTPNDLI